MRVVYFRSIVGGEERLVVMVMVMFFAWREFGDALMMEVGSMEEWSV